MSESYQHHDDCGAARLFGDKPCTCGLAALVADAEDMRSLRLYKKVIVAPDAYERISEKAARWDAHEAALATASAMMYRTDVEQMAADIQADAARFRKIAAAVDDEHSLTIYKESDDDYGVICWRHSPRLETSDKISEGTTLAAAVDKLPEAK